LPVSWRGVESLLVDYVTGKLTHAARRENGKSFQQLIIR